MKVTVIAAVMEAITYNGRPKVDTRLDRRDFEQLARMAAGSVMRKLYYEERQLGQQYWFFSSEVNTKEFKLSDPDSKRRRTVVLEDKVSKDLFSGVMRLPGGMGVLSVRPAGEVDGCVADDHIARIESGAAWLYMGRAYEGKMFYEPKSNKLVTYNIPDCINKLEVDGIFNLDDVEIPDDIAFDICNEVLGLTLKVAGFPIDKTNNNNPNLLALKSKLANPESI